MENQENILKKRSGIEVIEEQLGGFTEGKTYLIYGEPGTGKTIFGLQFLKEGLLQGERCMLVTQENPKDMLTMGKHLDMDWEGYLSSGKLILLNYIPHFSLQFTKSFNLDEVFHELQSFGENEKIDRLVFDPITPIVDCVNRINYTKVFTELFAHLDRLGSLTLLTLDEISGDYSSSFLRTLISLSFGVIHLRISPDLNRKMFFQKMKDQIHLLHPVTYTIEPRKGIVPLVPRKTRNWAKRKRILLADEDEENCEAIEEVMDDRYDLMIVHDGMDAVTEILNDSLDLVIMDSNLPRMDGFEVYERIRSRGYGVPVFFMTGSGEDMNGRINGFDHGDLVHMEKPLDPLELKSRIEKILRKRRVWNREANENFPSAKRKNSKSPFSSVSFRKEVESEIKRSPSHPFILVGYQLRGMDGESGKKLVRICIRSLVSEVRKDDFVGNLGNGKICVFLRRSRFPSSDQFIKRSKRKIRKDAKEKFDGSCPTFKIQTTAASFPRDGLDVSKMLEKVFRSPSRKS